MAGSVQLRTPRTAGEWRQYYALRWRILRSPWQAGGPEREPDEDASVHRMLCSDADEVLAVGRLHRVDADTGQIRFMAVAEGHQRRGYGTRLLRSLENAARELGLHTLILQAREQAVPFYRHQGYQLVEPSFLLFDAIQHYLMRKRLDG
jgi:N-acetylglutamate synthase-like GNAT family acetyltransferase